VQTADHVIDRYGQTADLIVVCPATARILADYRMGRSADLLSATLIATVAPVVVCPAMHTEMWEHPAVQENLAVLAQRGVHIVPPEDGRLAGGDTIEFQQSGQTWRFRLEHGVHGFWSPYRNLQAMLARHNLRPVFVPAREEVWMYKRPNGRITRVNPAANASTRQVEVLVAFDQGQKQPDVAGLYAEGRVETAYAEGLSLPATVIVRDGDSAFAWLVKAGKLHKTPVKVGDRDPRSGEFVLQGGLAAGDRVLRYPSSSLHDGQPAQLTGG